MNHGYDDSGSRIAVDWRTPVDYLEPKTDDEREATPLILLVERIADTFTRGDFRITMLAWRAVLGTEPESIRRCAARIGVTAAAVSRRARIISETFGLGLRNPHVRERRKEITRRSWQARRRRAEVTDPPPASNSVKPEHSHSGGPHE